MNIHKGFFMGLTLATNNKIVGGGGGNTVEEMFIPTLHNKINYNWFLDFMGWFDSSESINIVRIFW
jgi:hypothetical protein